MKVILSVIAVCLVMITTKLYIPEASAEVDGMDYEDLKNDEDFKDAVRATVGRYCRSRTNGSIYCSPY